MMIVSVLSVLCMSCLILCGKSYSTYSAEEIGEAVLKLIDSISFCSDYLKEDGAVSVQ